MKNDIHRWLGACGLLLALWLGAAAPATANQTCIDNAVIECFDGCLDPLNFQECLVGCAAGAYASAQLCHDQCFGNSVCLPNCLQVAERAQICIGATDKVDVVRGAIALNRSTGLWQQTVRFTNKTALDRLENLVLVLDRLTPGWTLGNADGTTQALAPYGSPFKNVALELRPGQSVTLLLRFSRTGTQRFNYAPVVYLTSAR
jgi:hypothetical protein